MIKRGTFVGLAAAAAAGTMTTRAGSQVERVAEDDPAISAGSVTLNREKQNVAAYQAHPRDENGATPGIVVVMHVWGVDESIREVVRELAKAGFAAIAPDLYSGMHAPSGDGKTDFTVFAPYAQQLQNAPVNGEIRAAAQWLQRRHPDAKVGVMGFCMGGTIALRQAIDNADVFAADGVWYGKVAGVDGAVRIPLLGSYGENDSSIPVAGVQAFREHLRVPHDVVVYPDAAHAFFDHTRRSYVENAAADSWKRAVAFFTKYLAP